MPTLEVIAGRKIVPMGIEHRGRKLALSFPFDKGLISEIKAMKGAEWDKDSRLWTVTDCRRNWMQLELLQGKTPKELERYDLTPEPVEPNRTQAMAHQRSMLAAAMTFRCVIFAAEQGVGKTLVYIEIMEHAAARGFTNVWFVAPLKVIRAIALELRKWKCKVEPRLLNYDILARELEAKFRCRGCSEVNVESRTHVRDGHGRCPECKRFGKHATVFVEHFGPWQPGTEPLFTCKAKRCAKTVPASLSRLAADDTRCPECGLEGRLVRIFERLPDPEAPHVAIFDESSFLKTSGTKRTEAAQLLADAIRAEHDGFVIEGSGTPAPKNPCDWQPQAEVAQPGFLRESTPNRLMDRLAIIEKGEGPDGRAFPNVVGWKKDEVELLHKRLQPLVQVHFAKDCLDLPELRHEAIVLEPSDELRRAARLIAQTSINTVQALSRLRQLSDGFQYGAQAICSACQGENFECEKCGGVGFAPADSVRAPCPKDDALAELLGRQEETGRIVVAAGFHESVDRATDVCVAEGWTVLQCDGRGWMIGEKNGKHRLRDEDADALLVEMDAGTRTERPNLSMVCHPGSGGYGLNLTAARANVLFSLDYNAASYWQFIKRSHRNGQTHGVTIYRLVHLKTDDLVFHNLEKKRELQSLTLGEIIEVLS